MIKYFLRLPQHQSYFFMFLYISIKQIFNILQLKNESFEYLKYSPILFYNLTFYFMKFKKMKNQENLEKWKIWKIWKFHIWNRSRLYGTGHAYMEHVTPIWNMSLFGKGQGQARQGSRVKARPGTQKIYFQMSESNDPKIIQSVYSNVIRCFQEGLSCWVYL